MVGGTAPLSALRSCRKPQQRSVERLAATGKRLPLSWGDNAVARAVGRLPAKVHVKLLIAFVGTAVLVMAVGLLGLRVLGQSNDRAERLGALQKRAFSYGKLQSDASHVRLLLAENVDEPFYKVWPGGSPTGRGAIGSRARTGPS